MDRPTGTSTGGHPEFLVVFKRRSEANVETLSRVLGIEQPPGFTHAVEPRTLLNPATEGRASIKVFNRLAIAATDLSELEREELEGADDVVEAVVRNEIRRLPPVQAFLDPSSSDGDAAIEYLRGHRDGVDHALKVLDRLSAPAGSGGLLALGPEAAASHSWCLEMIGVSAVNGWTGKGATVAILDTGIDAAHPDFASRIAPENVRSFISGVPTGHDGHGHGTHCAGVVAGPARPARGARYGVAPDCTVLIGKVLSDAGSGWDDDILDGIAWAADTGANVISMSLGSLRAKGQQAATAYEAVASKLLEQGVVLVAAAGNDSERPWSIAPVNNPAACSSILSVAAVDRHGAVAWFSCGDVDGIGTVDCAAPGVGVRSAMTGGKYALLSGTSMATPHVAGLLCLLVEAQPALKGRALWDALLSECSSLPAPATDVGWGLAQATSPPSPSVAASRTPARSARTSRGKHVDP